MGKTIVIQPGGYHPPHSGHMALYQSAQRAFPDAEVFVAATNDTSSRPFPFAVKEKLAKLAGVEPGHFVQVKSPFRAEEITSQFDPQRDVLIFVRSEKDKGSQPQPGGVKKDGSASYLQPLLGAQKLEPFAKHAYMAYLPTVEFGPGMTSATQIRTAWPTLNEKRKTALVMSLYPATQKNPKLAQTVVKLLDAAIGTEPVAETSLEDRLKKYVRPVVKTTPKIERTTNPAGRTTDHVEWKVTGPMGDVNRFSSKKAAQAHYDSFGKPGAGSLNEFAPSDGDDEGNPLDDYPCYDCGSTIYMHHTRLCDLAEPDAVRDLPAHPGTQHWTGRVPKGLTPIPGLDKGVAEGVELMTDAEVYRETLGVLALMATGFAAGAYAKIKDIIKMYNADQIMRALEGYRVGSISDSERRALTKLITEFKQAMAQRQGEQALAIANRIKSIATDRLGVEETVSASHTTANTSGAGAGMTASYQRRDNQPIAEDYLDERRL